MKNRIMVSNELCGVRVQRGAGDMEHCDVREHCDVKEQVGVSRRGLCAVLDRDTTKLRFDLTAPLCDITMVPGDITGATE